MEFRGRSARSLRPEAVDCELAHKLLETPTIRRGPLAAFPRLRQLALVQMDVEFLTGRERDTHWSIEVHLTGVLVGHISWDPVSGTYRYSRVPRAAPTPFDEDVDLAALLRRVARRP